MVDSSAAITNGRYIYIHDIQNIPLETIDVHHILVRKSFLNGFIVYLSSLCLIAVALFLFLVKNGSIFVILWSLIMSAVLVKLCLQKPVQKESIKIMPAFGVQLETQYGSGRTVRRFVPISKILEPVLNECVTPVTCYWNLSLVVQGKDELMLVFKELSPPVRMLVPIWKALCAAINIEKDPGQPI